jgi:phosphatidate cytidylyltransferase
LLRWRLLLGAGLIALMVVLCWLDYSARPATYLFPLAAVLSALAAGEMLWLLKARDIRPIPAIVYGGVILVVFSNLLPLFVPGYEPTTPLDSLAWPMLALTVSIIAAFFGEMVRYEKPGSVTVSLGTTILSIAYVGLLFSYIIQLRALGGDQQGVIALGAMVAVVKGGDIGAYTVGRLFGRHKLAPVLSPGKTIEGVAGGLIFSSAASWFMLEWLAPRIVSSPPALPSYFWLAFGVLVSVAGMIGDLAESLLKRDLGRKDSSPWLPGFGGVLDIVDSMLVASPVAYLCLYLAGFAK